MVNVEALKAATVNRRLKTLRRFCRWAQQNRLIKSNVALELKLVRTTRNTRPMGLTEPEVHSLLRLAGESLHRSRRSLLDQLVEIADRRARDDCNKEKRRVRKSEFRPIGSPARRARLIS